MRGNVISIMDCPVGALPELGMSPGTFAWAVSIAAAPRHSLRHWRADRVSAQWRADRVSAQWRADRVSAHWRADTVSADSRADRVSAIHIPHSGDWTTVMWIRRCESRSNDGIVDCYVLWKRSKFGLVVSRLVWLAAGCG